MNFLHYINVHWVRSVLFLIIGAPILAFLVIVVYSVLEVNRGTRERPQRVRDAQQFNTIRLTHKDVDGTNLPPPPNANEVNATVAGVDANHNIIRDDVELALFEIYPIQLTNPALPVTKENDVYFQSRAASLQYALASQVILTMVDTKEKMSVAEEMWGAAYVCMGLDDALVARNGALIFSPEFRKERKSHIYSTYANSSGRREGNDCDL